MRVARLSSLMIEMNAPIRELIPPTLLLRELYEDGGTRLVGTDCAGAWGDGAGAGAWRRRGSRRGQGRRRRDPSGGDQQGRRGCGGIGENEHFAVGAVTTGDRDSLPVECCGGYPIVRLDDPTRDGIGLPK